jgi:heparan-alpha-glucosaminide N-acetyltransferase
MNPAAVPTPAAAASARPAIIAPVETRLASMDAYRGFVMFLMMAEVLRLSRVAAAVPESGFWKFVAWHQTHVEWIGATLHDLIQPSFSFLVGVALPFSIAARLSRGQSKSGMLGHAVWRALLLVLLGVFLRSTGQNVTMTRWTFEDTLSQIGLGYPILFMLGFRPTRDQWIAFGAVVVGYFAAFALWPVPPADFDYSKVGLTQEWLAAHGQHGFAAHWQKNTNLAAAFDTWFLNLFPRDRPFVFHRGGYHTLSFIPTLATMILGLIAGNVLRSSRDTHAKIRWLVVAGLVALVGGWALGALGIVPVVKRIWTPSWVLFSGGWCFLLLAAFYWVIDVKQKKGWAFPLIVIGVNSIAAYVIAHLFDAFIAKSLTTHLSRSPFQVFGPAYEQLLLGAATLLGMWLILLWMYRRKLFLKI